MNPHIDIGRAYADRPQENPHIQLVPMAATPWAHHPTEFVITKDGAQQRLPVWYSHLALLKLVKQYDFQTVLDIGTNDGRVAYVFEALGKTVTGLEPCASPGSPDLPTREIDIERDYFDVSFSKKFDAIWCSHVLEHVRNPGAFLDKIFDDLKEGGTLAITVPFFDFDVSATSVLLGHHNKYNHWLLVYQLVCAGFDCKEASIAVYSGMTSVIVRKVPNNVQRSTAALYSPYPPSQKMWSKDGHFVEPRIFDFFPFEWKGTSFDNPTMFVNWGDPI